MTTPPKYARLENERRWLVTAGSPWRELAAPYAKRLQDRYLSCGRLRVRELTDVGTAEVVYKLTKKYESPDPLSRPITTLYLTREEHDALRQLPGHDLVKVRHYVEAAPHIFSVDVFEGPLAGLVICEIESPTLEEARSLRAPDWAGPEITGSPFFTCAHLATVNSEELSRELPEAVTP